MQNNHFQTVGSLLRPQELKDYIDKYDVLPVNYLSYAKDNVLKELESGLDIVTDGEINRIWWQLDFIFHLNNCERGSKFNWTFASHDAPAQNIEVKGKIGAKNHPFITDWKYTQSLCTNTVKLCIPSIVQTVASFLDISKRKLPPSTKKFYNIFSLIKDLEKAYKEFLDDYKKNNGKIIQMDDCLWAMFARDGSSSLEKTKKAPKFLARIFIRLNNKIITYAHSIGLTVWAHNCRGNHQSDYAGSGSYDSIAKLFLRHLKYDRFFLEYDSERSGSLDALRVLAKKKNIPEVVVGALSSKFPVTSNEDEIIKKLEYVFSFYPKDKVYLSHQCGFASCHQGNLLSYSEQWEQLRYGTRIASKVWGK
jgi:methionine synthase II (cobalamin-independent)